MFLVFVSIKLLLVNVLVIGFLELFFLFELFKSMVIFIFVEFFFCNIRLLLVFKGFVENKSFF